MTADTAWATNSPCRAGKRSVCWFITLCVETREWKRLAARARVAADADLEALSHYCTEPGAKGLAKHDSLAAVKLHRALGLRILNSGKTKYYDAALNHFDSARRLCSHAGREEEWRAVVSAVCARHFRKTGFLHAFLSLGTRTRSPAPLSFVQKARERWRKQTS